MTEFALIPGAWFGHWPMLSDPATRAALLDAIAGGTAALPPLSPTEA
jgi:hypothetical protein